MESLTKNKQSREVICEMVRRFFGPDEMEECRELTEGYFNVAYEVRLKSGKCVILKIAPPEDVPVMSYEKNIMESEIRSMKMAADCPEIPVPLIYGYDESRTVCPSSYFFMEKLAGCSLFSTKEKLSSKQLRSIQLQVGSINRRINEIACPCFGYPGQPDLQGEVWFPVFKSMLQLGVKDAGDRDINLKIPVDTMWEYLKRDREFFDEVTVPRLVHWDCWDGNIFVRDGSVTGIIDWERCLWADPLMEAGFRTYGENDDFKEGYGLSAMTKAQHRRAVWYDIYAMVLVALECEYRGYETMEMYEWSTGMLVKKLHELGAQEDPLDVHMWSHLAALKD